MSQKNVLLGVTGGIAAYKACDLVSRLKKLNYSIDVIMTKAATQFVNPLTFQSLSHNKVVTDMFESPKYWEIEHISLAKKADIVVVAPATANLIAKLAHGIADDMLSTTLMATSAPIVVAPAMNTQMYQQAALQENLMILKKRAVNIIEPAAGLLACDDIGKGKLAPVEEIVQVIETIAKQSTQLLGKRLLITAGPTVERIDPVRFISNRSTGKMGYRLAEVARLMSAEVTLITGPTQLKAPQGVSVIGVESAEEMFQAVQAHIARQDVFISVAAVADYRPKDILRHKMKKTAGDLSLSLVRTPDIAAQVGAAKGDCYFVGFSAETENLIENSLKKIEKKNFDMIVANDIGAAGAGFAGDTNIVTLIMRSGETIALPKQSKTEVAKVILEKIADAITRG